MQEMSNYMGHSLKDTKARLNIKELRSDADELLADMKSARSAINLPYYLANLAPSYDSTGKYTNVNSAESKAEHESSLMMVNGSPAVYFLRNTETTADTSPACKGCIYQNGTITVLEDILGINIGTGRTQHGDTDVIIANGDDGSTILGVYLTKYENSEWTTSMFTNNSGLNIDGCNSQMLYKNEKFYHLLCKDTTKTFPILVFDPATMTIEKVSELSLPITFEGIYEANLYEFNSEIYFSIRPSYNSLKRGYKGKTIIGKIESLENPVVTQYVYVPDGSNRGMFFTYKSRLFFETTEYDRITGHIFDVTDLVCDPVMTVKYNVNYADALVSNNTIYWCASDIKNTPGGSKVVYGTFPYTGSLV